MVCSQGEAWRFGSQVNLGTNPSCSPLPKIMQLLRMKHCSSLKKVLLRDSYQWPMNWVFKLPCIKSQGNFQKMQILVEPVLRWTQRAHWWYKVAVFQPARVGTGAPTVTQSRNEWGMWSEQLECFSLRTECTTSSRPLALLPYLIKIFKPPGNPKHKKLPSLDNCLLCIRIQETSACLRSFSSLPGYHSVKGENLFIEGRGRGVGSWLLPEYWYLG